MSLSDTHIDTMIGTILIIAAPSPAGDQLARMLREQGCVIRTTSYGSATVDAVARTAPNIILLGLGAADGDAAGYTFCRQLQSDMRTQAIPVMFVCSQAAPLDRERIFAAGGADYLVAPFLLAEVQARVQPRLALRRLERELDLRVQARTTDMLQTNRALQADIAARAQTERALRRVERALRALSACNTSLLHARDEAELLTTICQVMVTQGGYRMAWVGFAEHDADKTVRPVAHAGDAQDYISSLQITWDTSERGRGPTGTALRTGTPAVVTNIATDPQYAPWRDAAQRHGYASSIALPLIGGGQILGVLNVYAADADAFDREEVDLLDQLADNLAYGMQTLRERAAHQQMTSALHKREVEYQSLFRHMPSGVAYHQVLCDAQNRPIDLLYVDVNDLFEEHAGFARADVLGRRVTEIFPGITAAEPDLIHIYGQVGLTGVCTRLEFYFPPRDKWFAIAAYSPRPGYCVTISEDISERKQTEAVLRQSEARYQTVIQNFPNGGIFLFDYDLRYTFADGQGLRDVGLSSDMLEGKTIWEIFDAETVTILEPHYRNALAGQNAMFEVAFGGFIYQVHTLPMRDEHGSMTVGMVISQDITRHRELEAALRTNQARMQAMLDNAAAGIIVLDTNGRFREVNDRWLAMTGYTDAEMLQMMPWDITHPDDVAGSRAQFMRLLRGEIRNYRLEKCYIRKDGSMFWADLAVTVIRNMQNEIEMILAVVIDISDRKQAEEAVRQLNADLEQRVLERTHALSQANAALQAEIAERRRTEEALRESRRFIENVANTIPDLLYVYDIITMQNIYVNREIALVLGYTPEQIHAMGTAVIPTLLHPDDLECGTTWQLQRIAAAADGEILELEYRMKHADGTWRRLAVRETVFTRTPDGKPEQILGVSQDITERKQAEAALRRSEERFRLLAEHAPDVLYRYRLAPSRGYEYISPAVTAILGYTPEEHYADPDLALKMSHPDTLGLIQTFHQSPGDYREPLIFHFMSKAGRDVWMEQHSWPIFDEDARLIAVEGIARNVTERKRADEQLRRYAEELQQSVAETRQFAYIVSHDLRAPLVNLKGFAAELQMAMDDIRPALDQALTCLDAPRRQELLTAIDEDVPEALGFITSSVDRMDHLINALLKLSRLGRREITPELLDMQALVTTTLQTLAHQIESRQVAVRVAPLPTVMADPTAMEQILGNILNNAVLYLDPARPGQIDIGGESGNENANIYIRDNGRGITPEDMDKVFAPFRRIGKPDVAGEGMGLAYVQALVRRHGGHIWCASAPGVGTTFTISLPNLLPEEC
jgi:PAS domain S-box-containing protein